MSEYEEQAEFYDFVSKPLFGDVEFYRRLGEAIGGPVLEIGIGTGRVAIPLAEAGIPVVGVDDSPAMLDVLRGKLESSETAGNIELFEGDMRTLDLPNRYRLIIAPFRAFNHMLTDADRRAALTSMKAHLAPEGRIAIHTFGPLFHLLAQDYRVIPIRKRDLPDGRSLLGEDRIRYDHNRKLIEVERIMEVFNGGDSPAKKVVTFTITYIFPEELTLTAELCGLELDRLFGDFEGRDYSYPERIEAVHLLKHPDAPARELPF